jgi:hypothetical protein
MDPHVSILIPAHSAQRWIADTLKSVLGPKRSNHCRRWVVRRNPENCSKLRFHERIGRLPTRSQSPFTLPGRFEPIAGCRRSPFGKQNLCQMGGETKPPSKILRLSSPWRSGQADVLVFQTLAMEARERVMCLFSFERSRFEWSLAAQG